jgi:ethanolamine utilization protein EutQ (cupin superfamily)
MTSAVQELIRKYDSELLNHPDVRAAVTELKGIIRHTYPEARFEVVVGHEPLGVYVTTMVDEEDTERVSELYMDRILEFQVDKRIPIYVLTLPSDQAVMADALG